MKLSPSMKKVQAVSLVIGLALFFYLINKVGFGVILTSLQTLGAGFLVLLVISGLRHMFRAVAWGLCIEKQHGTIKVTELFNIRMAGEAIRFVSFTGPFLGEPSKAALLRKRMPMVHGLSSVIVENMTYSLAAAIVSVVGVAVLLANFSLHNRVKWIAFGIVLFVVLLVWLIRRAIVKESFPLARALRLIDRHTGRTWFGQKAASAEQMEECIYRFYKSNSRTFVLVLSIDLLAHVTNIFEVYLILVFLGSEGTLLAAFIIEAGMKIINAAFFFVPAQVGVFEGGNALILKALGLGMSTGIALALVEKMRTLFWTGYGMLILTLKFGKHAINSRREPAPSASTGPNSSEVNISLLEVKQ